MKWLGRILEALGRAIVSPLVGLEKFGQRAPMITQLIVQIVAGLLIIGISGLIVAGMSGQFEDRKDAQIVEVEAGPESSAPDEAEPLTPPGFDADPQNSLSPAFPGEPDDGSARSSLAASCSKSAELLTLAQQYLDSHVSPCIANRDVVQLPHPRCVERDGRVELRADYSVTGQAFQDTSIVRLCYRGRGDFDPARLQYRLISGNLRELCAFRGASSSFLGDDCR